MSIDPDVQRAYSAIQRSFVEAGRAPHYTELARSLGVDVEKARRLQREADVLDDLGRNGLRWRPR